MKLPLIPPPMEELARGLDAQRWVELVVQPLPAQSTDDPYPHWDALVHRRPPDGLSTREWWLRLKLDRQGSRREIPLRTPAGAAFSYTLPDVAMDRLHRIDRQAGGRISMAETVTNPATRDRYLVSSLIEEAITSSQLEGASTSRRIAKDMLRTGRPARDRSEQMILNNYRTMQHVREIRDERLVPDLVLDLQRRVTAGTLDDDQDSGCLLRPDDVRVQVWDGGRVLYTPPPAEELPDRLAALCGFANADDDTGFIHPVVRAVILHFWLAYDHPFADGNGRTARALFYWAMLANGYWLTEFLAVSAVLRRAPVRYFRSFLYTESDDNDLTYFILHQLAVISRAVEALEQYLRRKMSEVRDVETLLAGRVHVNHRQRALLGHALRDPSARYSIRSHQKSHGVVYQTARTDLLDLANRGLLHSDPNPRVGTNVDLRTDR